ncbi:hypothetical protein BKE30_12890 [Alkanindiges hydrocarboniclasticus]|jgi:hypothetical protein|uniref:Uncharacterized protein n=1 Tax=Alkanindiges hydrocarboniclasticus TaxID=1907941 RepID=A0A1S8CTD5_9GAMM|nr:hypothetical protein [Alkanindiges hydrocarboniclasticus]ONG38400.1 hypothetical protein BKE30_12890 [Alkanindiges hydrocarboniclasticus]
MLVQDILKAVFDNTETLRHAKEVLFKDYLDIINSENQEIYILYFDDIGQKKIDIHEIKFSIESIVFQYDHMVGDNKVRVIVRVGDTRAKYGLVTSSLGRLILYYSGEPFDEDLYPYSSDYLYQE